MVMHKDVFTGAFVQDLHRPHPAEHGVRWAGAGRDELWASFAAASGARDVHAYVSAGRALRDAGQLKPVPAIRLARRMIDVGLWAETSDLLEDPLLAGHRDDPERLGLLSWALLGAGRQAEARAAFERAVTAGFAGAHAELASRIGWALGAREHGLEASSWTSISGPVSQCLQLGLASVAADALEAWISRRFDPSDAQEIIEAAACTLRMADPEQSPRLLRALRPLFQSTDQARALDDALAAIESHRDEACSEPSTDLGVLAIVLAEGLSAAGRWTEAIRLLRVQPGQRGVARHAMSELARCVGRDILSRTPLDLRTGGPAKVFDLFPFNGEFEMLGFKLGEMSGWVDRFVIVEAAKTFTGLDKPILFRPDDPRIAPFADRITHVVVDAFPPHLTSAWAREFHQRDSAARALSGLAGPEDIVLLSDVDEIIQSSTIERVTTAAGAELRTFKYFYNLELAGKPRIKTAVVRAKTLLANGSSYLRVGLAAFEPVERLTNAGWHFTSIGTPEALEQKMKCSSHQEWSHLDQSYFEEVMRGLKTGDPGKDWIRREIDDDLPAFVLQNRAALEDFLL
jgi:beta-1,4-mannosyl-glycoprotein beta-1,4-N-acetylglucosaminyltransferase